MADWTTPTAIHSVCGETTTYYDHLTIDSDTATMWAHVTAEYHWIIFDLGVAKVVSKVQLYQTVAAGNRWGGTSGATVYVSTSVDSWGDSVWEGLLNAGSGWQESGAFSKTGRYVKMVSLRSSNADRMCEMQAECTLIPPEPSATLSGSGTLTAACYDPDTILLTMASGENTPHGSGYASGVDKAYISTKTTPYKLCRFDPTTMAYSVYTGAAGRLTAPALVVVGSTVYVATADATYSYIDRFATSTSPPSLVGSWNLGGYGAGESIDSDGTYLYVGTPTRYVLKVRISDGVVTASRLLTNLGDNYIHALRYDAETGKVFCTTINGYIYRLAASDLAEEDYEATAAPTLSDDIALSTGYIWLPPEAGYIAGRSGWVIKVSKTDLAAQTLMTVGPSNATSLGCFEDPGGTYIWVAWSASNPVKISRVKISDGTVVVYSVAGVTVPYASEIIFAPDADKLVVSLYGVSPFQVYRFNDLAVHWPGVPTVYGAASLSGSGTVVAAGDVGLTVQVAAAVDDGELFPMGGTWTNSTTYMDIGRKDVLPPNGAWKDIFGWWRWAAVNVPQGANVTAAKIQFKAQYTESTAVDLRVEGCAEDDSDALASYVDYVSRPKLPLVNWNGVEGWTADAWHWSTDISAIVQALVNRQGWASGQAMQVIVKGIESGVWAERRAYAYDTDPLYAAKLNVEWSGVSEVGAAAISGSGTLTASATVTKVAAASLSGSGTVTAVGAKAHFGQAALSGSGTATAAGARVLRGIAALAGSGVASAVAALVLTGAAVLSGSGSASAVGGVQRPAAAGLSGSGTLVATASATSAHAGAASLSGRGVVGQRIKYGSGLLWGDGWVWGRGYVDASVTRAGQAALSASGTLEALGAVGGEALGRADLSGAGTLTAQGTQIHRATSAVSGSGTVVASGQVTRGAAAGLSGSGTVAAAGHRTQSGAATLAGAGAVAAAGRLTTTVQAALSGSGTVSAAGVRIRPAASALAGSGMVTAAGHMIWGGTAALAGAGALTAQGEVGGEALGRADLAGAGALTAVGRLTSVGTTTLSGSGTLTVSGHRTVSAAAILSGSGTTTGAGHLTKAGAAVLSGSGTVSSFGQLTRRGAALLAGSGSLEALAAVGGEALGRADLSGDGTVTAHGTQIHQAASAPVGSGTLTASGTRTIPAAVVLSGAGSAAGSGHLAKGGAAALSGSGTVTAIGARSLPAASALSGEGSLTAQGETGTERLGRAELTGSGSIVAHGTQVSKATAVLASEGTLTAGGHIARPGASVLSASGSLTASAVIAVVTGQAALSGQGSLAVAGCVTRSAAATLSGAGALTAQAETGGEKLGGAVLSGTGALTAAGSTRLAGLAALSGAGTLTASGARARAATAALAGDGALTAGAVLGLPGAAGLSGTGTLTAQGEIGSERLGRADLSGAGALTIAGRATWAGQAALAGSGTLTAAATISTQHSGAAALSGAGAVTSTGAATLPGAASLAGSGTLTAAGVRMPGGGAALSGSGTLTAAGSQTLRGGAALAGAGTVQAAGVVTAKGAASLSGSGTVAVTAAMGAAKIISVLASSVTVISVGGSL